MSEMKRPSGGTLVYLHGTWGSGADRAETIRGQLAAVPALADLAVLEPDWSQDGPVDRPITAALPPRYAAGPQVSAEDAERNLERFALDFFEQNPLPPEAAGTDRELIPAGGLLGHLALQALTSAAVHERVELTEAASDFARNIVFYLRSGARVRRRIDAVLRSLPQDQPVVVLGHSLGGVAAVDLLTDPQLDRGGLRVDLLVTVGSQAPWLHLLGGPVHDGPDNGGSLAAPWLNIYDERDLLSFCAGRVFTDAPQRVLDVEVSSGKPFPASHTDYFDNPEVYAALAVELLRELDRP